VDTGVLEPSQLEPAYRIDELVERRESEIDGLTVEQKPGDRREVQLLLLVLPHRVDLSDHLLIREAAFELLLAHSELPGDLRQRPDRLRRCQCDDDGPRRACGIRAWRPLRRQDPFGS
jgi:hypothetical protein